MCIENATIMGAFLVGYFTCGRNACLFLQQTNFVEDFFGGSEEVRYLHLSAAKRGRV